MACSSLSCRYFSFVPQMNSSSCKFNSVQFNSIQYSETCEIRTSLGRAINVPNSEVSSFHRAICTENSSLGPDEVSLFHRMFSFRRVAIHRFYSISLLPFLTQVKRWNFPSAETLRKLHSIKRHYKLHGCNPNPMVATKQHKETLQIAWL
jgi:hypothetical protein